MSSNVAQPSPLNGLYDLYCLFKHTTVFDGWVLGLGHGLELCDRSSVGLQDRIPLELDWRPPACLNTMACLVAFSL